MDSQAKRVKLVLAGALPVNGSARDSEVGHESGLRDPASGGSTAAAWVSVDMPDCDAR